MTVEIPGQYTHSVKLVDTSQTTDTIGHVCTYKMELCLPTNPEEPSGNSGLHLQHPFANVPDGHFSQWVPT